MKKQNGVGLGQVIGKLRLVFGLRHDDPRDIFEDYGFDRSLVEEIGDQHRESITHRTLLPNGRHRLQAVPRASRLAGRFGHASTTFGSATAKIGIRTGTTAHAQMFRPVANGRQFGDQRPLRNDIGDVVEWQVPRLVTVFRWKEPESTIGQGERSGFPHPSRAAPRRRTGDDCLTGGQVKQSS